jgi:hypothetical protein
MSSILFFSFFKVIKLVNFKYFNINILKKKIILKNISFFLFKKNNLFFLNKKIQNVFFNLFLKKLLTFLKCYKIYFNLQGKLFKFYIYNFFFFLKMDTSKFTILKMINNFYLKKSKKIIQFYFFDIKIFHLIKNIQKLKVPNKYTKKGIFFSKKIK